MFILYNLDENFVEEFDSKEEVKERLEELVDDYDDMDDFKVVSVDEEYEVETETKNEVSLVKV